MPFSLVDIDEFHKLLQEMGKYQVPHLKGVSRDQQDTKSFTRKQFDRC